MTSAKSNVTLSIFILPTCITWALLLGFLSIFSHLMSLILLNSEFHVTLSDPPKAFATRAEHQIEPANATAEAVRAAPRAVQGLRRRNFQRIKWVKFMNLSVVVVV